MQRLSKRLFLSCTSSTQELLQRRLGAVAWASQKRPSIHEEEPCFARKPLVPKGNLKGMKWNATITVYQLKTGETLIQGGFCWKPLGGSTTIMCSSIFRPMRTFFSPKNGHHQTLLMTTPWHLQNWWEWESRSLENRWFGLAKWSKCILTFPGFAWICFYYPDFYDAMNVFYDSSPGNSFFNRRYISSNVCFSIVMWVFGGCSVSHHLIGDWNLELFFPKHDGTSICRGFAPKQRQWFSLNQL